MRHVAVLAGILWLGSAGPLTAQIPTVPTSLGEAQTTATPITELAELTRLYNNGSWKELQTKASAIIAALSTFSKLTDDYHVVLLWPGKDAAGEDALLWIVVHTPRPEAYTTTLPGLTGTTKSLFEVYLSAQPGAGFTSYYVSTQVDDPLLAQIPTVAERIAEPLFALFGGAAGALPPRVTAAAPPAAVYAWIRKVPLPMARADVKAHYFAAEPIPLKQFTNSATQLATRLRFGAASHSACARDLATTLAAAATAVAEKSCKAPTEKDTDAEKRRQIAADCLAAFDSRFFADYTKGVSSCPDDEAARAVNSEFRQLVTNWRPVKLEAEVSFQNRPLTHLGFGMLSSFAFSGRTTEPRAKVDDGIVVEDPLPRVLTAIVLNYNIPGYNASSTRIGWRERFNLFGGATITPGFGVTTGFNFVLVRGLGLNAGYARVFHTAKRSTDEFGEPPSDELDPLGVATVGVWFAGLSYNFK